VVTESEIWQVLEEVKDPEIPAISVVDMGIITGVEVNNGEVKVTMTPTFAGCPAIRMMEDDIKEKLSKLDIKKAEVEVSFDTQWSSNMITEKGRRILKESGFAPPAHVSDLVQIDLLTNVACPFCGSTDTKLQTPFGPTLCRAIHYCNHCLQAFEQFKPI
jgi:ring-1,2-phenylacetyl-CoA epoxidase subunit PaaD